MRWTVSRCDVPYCLTPQCNGLVKPDIVFFGEQLPEEFHRDRSLPSSADLCIVMGTSLTVQPFASLPGFCLDGVPRVLINLERVGGLGSRSDDVLLLGDCDAGVRKLAAALGWEKDLEALWGTRVPEKSTLDHKVLQGDKKELIDDQIDSLTRELQQSLKVSATYTAKIRKQLSLSEAESNFSSGACAFDAPITKDDSEVEALSVNGPQAVPESNS